MANICQEFFKSLFHFRQNVWLNQFYQTNKSPTSKLWTGNLIHPVLLMMFTRAERESDWNLHLYVTNKMIDYSLAAGHINYACYGTYYLHTICRPSRRSQITITNCRTNQIWTDQAIESTKMQKGHNTEVLVMLEISQVQKLRHAGHSLFLQSLK